jgi:hypothetical protein
MKGMGKDDGTSWIYSYEISVVICSYQLVIVFGEVTIIFNKGSRWNTFGAWGRLKVTSVMVARIRDKWWSFTATGSTMEAVKMAGLLVVDG